MGQDPHVRKMNSMLIVEHLGLCSMATSFDITFSHIKW